MTYVPRHLPVASLDDVTHNFEQLASENVVFGQEGKKGATGPTGPTGPEGKEGAKGGAFSEAELEAKFVTLATEQTVSATKKFSKPVELEGAAANIKVLKVVPNALEVSTAGTNIIEYPLAIKMTSKKAVFRGLVVGGEIEYTNSLESGTAMQLFRNEVNLKSSKTTMKAATTFVQSIALSPQATGTTGWSAQALEGSVTLTEPVGAGATATMSAGGITTVSTGAVTVNKGWTVPIVRALRVINATKGAEATIEKQVGVHIEALTSGTLNLSLLSEGAEAQMRHAGNVKIGANAEPAYTLDVAGKARVSEGLGVFNKAPPAGQPAEIKPEEITVKALMEKLNTLHKEYGLTA